MQMKGSLLKPYIELVFSIFERIYSRYLRNRVGNRRAWLSWLAHLQAVLKHRQNAVKRITVKIWYSMVLLAVGVKTF